MAEFEIIDTVSAPIRTVRSIDAVFIVFSLHRESSFQYIRSFETLFADFARDGRDVFLVGTHNTHVLPSRIRVQEDDVLEFGRTIHAPYFKILAMNMDGAEKAWGLLLDRRLRSIEHVININHPIETLPAFPIPIPLARAATNKPASIVQSAKAVSARFCRCVGLRKQKSRIWY